MKIRCIETVISSHDDKVRFIKGNTYKAKIQEYNGELEIYTIDEQGHYHTLSGVGEWFTSHFEV